MLNRSHCLVWRANAPGRHYGRDARGRIDAIDDLRHAIRATADRCAERLREQGYAVTSVDVIGALEDALARSELLRPPADALN